jgi:hypothetical protein
MGNRAFIQVTSESFPTPLHLYGHWSGEDNLEAVKNVLTRTDRIGDPTYLAAQLFHEFAVALGGYDGNLSFGIGVGEIDESDWVNAPTVYVNADTGEVTVDGEEIVIPKQPHQIAK